MNPQLFTVARAALSRLTAVAPTSAWWVPGRIEVLGKHTDYAGGRVLTCATNRGLAMVGARREDDTIRVVSNGEEVWCGASAALASAPLSSAPLSSALGWTIYVETVVARLRANFPGRVHGADLALASDVPRASGMSSSSALIIALTATLAELNGLDLDPRWPMTATDVAGYAACIENGNDFDALAGHTGVGTIGGAMDHTAMCGAQKGMLTCWSLAPTIRVGDVPLPPGTRLLIAVCGVLAEKTGAARIAYNQVAGRAHAALAAWNLYAQRRDRTLAEAVNAGVRADDLSDHDFALRLEQFIRESTVLVPTATSALAAGDITSFAAAVAESQALATTHLRNQIPETSALVEYALKAGAYAASAFGAGFGGAVWALVDEARAESCATTWLDFYRLTFPHHRGSSILSIDPGSRAQRIERR